MIAVKTLHIISLLIWCAGLLYLPGLFMMHPRATRPATFHRVRVMTRFTFAYVISPAAVIAILSGTALVYLREVHAEWLMWKLLAVTLMVFFHLYCGGLVGLLGKERRSYSWSFHATLVAVPAVIIPTILWLVMAKPDFQMTRFL